MLKASELTELLGWISLINLAYLLLATLVVTAMRSMAVSLHRKILPVGEKELNISYFNFLAHYKVVTLAFFMAPYIALKVMGY